MSAGTSASDQRYIWQVYFEQTGPFWEVTLTYNRQLPNGTHVKFDEDPEGILDLAIDADNHLLMKGFLALIPEGELLSCSLRTVKHTLLIWTHSYHQPIFAAYDKQRIVHEFAGRLWNPDSSIDLLFVGGDQAAHTTSTIEYWTKALIAGLSKSSDEEKMQILAQVLQVYREIFYTQTTEIHLWTRMENQNSAEVRNRLAQVAAHYGLMLPPE